MPQVTAPEVPTWGIWSYSKFQYRRTHHFFLNMSIPVHLLQNGVVTAFLQRIHEPPESDADILQCEGQLRATIASESIDAGSGLKVNIYNTISRIPTCHWTIVHGTMIMVPLRVSYSCGHKITATLLPLKSDWFII